jgi:hypothetical protein
VIAWSWILNLGILARQRSLVVPFVLVIFAYGWYDESRAESSDQTALPVPAPVA